MRNALPKNLSLILIISLTVLTTPGQESTLSLSGTVTRYEITSLYLGVYTVTVTAAGFKKAAVTDVKTDVGKNTHINVAVEAGTAKETVRVSDCGEVPHPSTVNGSPQASLNITHDGINVQEKFVHRNSALNANYLFNNLDLAFQTVPTT